MSTFKFKYFQVEQVPNVHSVGTDAMILGALINAHDPETILDIGTGTGVLSLMMGQVYPHAKITAIDVNEQAVELANMNFDHSPFSNRLEIKHLDLNSFTENTSSQFDLIISNPPYFENSTPAKGEGRNSARHQSSLSLEDLLKSVAELLSAHGSCWLILPVDQFEKVQNTEVLYCSKRIKIFGKPGKHVRDVICLSKNESSYHEEALTIRDEHGNYTEAYKSATLEFHGVAL